MIEGEYRLPEYGLGGDYAGARRARRAFRIGVLCFLLLTLLLFMAERYLRYDLNETKYIMALTLDPARARPILRDAVRRDTAENDLPAAKYVEALAAIEEEDLVLPAYEQAFRLSPSNPALMVNYGCRLFLEGQYGEARERFREAGIASQRNALPRYLEAAALLMSIPPGEDTAEVLSLLVRASNSGDPLVFPKPLWHSSLPESGYWYSQLLRDQVDLCLAPLYRLKRTVVGRAESGITAGEVDEWDTWLKQVQELGAKLVGVPQTHPASRLAPAAMTGLRFQIDALRQRARIQELFGEEPAAIYARVEALRAALAHLQDFESSRDQRIAMHRQAVQRPLWVVGAGFTIVLLLYASAYFICRVFRVRRTSWTIAHRPLARGVLIAGLAALLLGLLLFIPATQAGAAAWGIAVALFWYAVLAALCIFGWLYPAGALPAPRNVAEAHERTEDEEFLAFAKKARRTAYFALARRYYGLLLGGLMCVICAWIIFHRIAVGLYPTQLSLVTTGLRAQELAVIDHVQQMLYNAG